MGPRAGLYLLMFARFQKSWKDLARRQTRVADSGTDSKTETGPAGAAGGAGC